MLRLLIIGLIATTSMASAQTAITWEILGDVEFTDKYSEEVEAYYYYPHFGPNVKDLDGQMVYIKGYMLPINPKKGVYILSKNPYASCFFCGNGGPESIIELKLQPGHPKFRMDEVVTIKGRLKLNRDDIYQCNYILEEAKVY
ncbi:hypothetical protein GCM10009122_60690 [Fulvivirga kasyanovii]|uniref:DUF3299 domain-containing protein n=1 Tax=Fulvivirga kasyanovii TaxID=396812 RepID=A0ABW9RK58_9BACT|nr:DUF3299 domain-containing protein [Fulvivirga kasyanovii]MTI24056.1 DUF3299 domain-containing protein [Fulvivirga kasyanovii]